MFSDCTMRELRAIVHLVDEIDADAGTVLMREGRVGRECMVVVAGEARVTLDGRELARLGPGSIFGEMAFLDRQPRSATVTARIPTQLLVMSNLGFATVLDICPSVRLKVLQTLSRRLRTVQSGSNGPSPDNGSRPVRLRHAPN
jgi:CRP-like cAMP-binding protein